MAQRLGKSDRQWVLDTLVKEYGGLGNGLVDRETIKLFADEYDVGVPQWLTNGIADRAGCCIGGQGTCRRGETRMALIFVNGILQVPIEPAYSAHLPTVTIGGTFTRAQAKGANLARGSRRCAVARVAPSNFRRFDRVSKCHPGP